MLRTVSMGRRSRDSSASLRDHYPEITTFSVGGTEETVHSLRPRLRDNDFLSGQDQQRSQSLRPLLRDNDFLNGQDQERP